MQRQIQPGHANEAPLDQDRVGYSGDELGVLLSVQSVVGLIGPLLAAMIGKRFGMSTPVILAGLLTGATSLSYVLGEHSKTMYTAGVMTI
ncbi:hypothetical protein [Pseudomonas japonica]|uniref:Uncharacterized protein n=1 Tax=Pseudomonas japonica TaxID=256466 RepID=A0A239KP32_9PSED|nr:hypothetical protein [Pseudomonas japonica]SNT19931.1 hypothetical protein SAMN05444352_12839 [Pseudomonas japonica]